MSIINLTCPHCERDVSIIDQRQSRSTHTFMSGDMTQQLTLVSSWYVCPNQKCNQPVLTVAVHNSEGTKNSFGFSLGEQLLIRRLIPASYARVFPTYVPEAIRDDYQEACAVISDSPKAAATLARRAIQGIIRDFYKVKAGNLASEIRQLENIIDPDIWAAIDTVRNVGNIGAHMEKDINVIVPVDEGEAELLIKLIETLVNECYVARDKRQHRLAQIKALGEAKKLEQREGRKSKKQAVVQALPIDEGNDQG